jgi:outer membrane protein insertion porin family
MMMLCPSDKISSSGGNSKQQKGTRLVLLLMILFFGLQGYAQLEGDKLPVMDYTTPREYEIADVTVSGVKYLDKKVLVMLSGLAKGDKITVPGEDVTKAIEKLWEQGLFEDVSIIAKDIQGDKIFLDIQLQERPRLTAFSFKGIKKAEADNIRDKISLTRGDVVTDNLLINTRNTIRKHFAEKGFLDTEVEIDQIADTLRGNSVFLNIKIDKKKRVRIFEINFHGNEELPDQRLKNALKETKEKGTFRPLNDLEVMLFNVIKNTFRMDLDSVVASAQKHLNDNIKIRLFKGSKYIEDKYEEDKINIIRKYNELGFRDAVILKDSVYRNPDNTVSIDFYIDEGDRYYFRNIFWVGNTKYSDETLSRFLKIQKGDVYNQEFLETNLQFNPAGTDVSSLYMDNGYLFFQAVPVEVLVENDSIDLEIRISEGKQARINRVSVIGNDKTNDHVIIRELRTVPGDLFSRSNVIRTTRELAQLRYFDPEKIAPDIVPDATGGTVDITYQVEETSADQIELSGGWGYGRIIGTLGLSFNNFSLKNLFKGEAWKPVPSGDGQKLSLRVQSYGRGFLSYSVSFTEPWLGGRKPNAFSVTYWHSLYSNGLPKNDPNRSEFVIDGVTLGLGKRLKWPDDYFSLYQAITLQRYELFQYSQIFAFGTGTGQYNNFSYNIVLSRNSISQPIYPRSGSEVSISLELTPPYSAFRSPNIYAQDDNAKYKWIEYHKWKLNLSFFTEVFPKAVVMARAKYGFLGAYDKELGVRPFDRFYLGGDGLSGYNNLDGREIIGMRGYGNETITPNYFLNRNIGGTIYSKYTLEFRYPLSLNPSSTIYASAFIEGGNSWLTWDDFNPFSIYRSAGIGLRVFLPMFGLLGLDWGYGFDEVPGIPSANGSQFHFSINSSID